MADYWKSQPRKFCDFCKCWIADNKPSRDFHERGKRHQENLTKRISELRKKGLEQAKNEKDAANWMVQMEKEALKKLQEDLTADPSLAAQYGVIIKSRSEELNEVQGASAEATHVITNNGSSDWQEALSPEGYVYYWNVKTGDSRWDIPNFDMSEDSATDSIETGEPACPSTDAERVVQKSTSGQDKTNDVGDESKPIDSVEKKIVSLESEKSTDCASVWQQLLSPEGYPYYWNTGTGEVSWELPANRVKNEVKSKTEMEKDSTAANGSPVVKEATVAEDEKQPVLPADKSPLGSNVEPSKKRSAHSVYGEWQELKEEPEQMIDLELPVDPNKTEVKMIILSQEPKLRFKEKTVSSLAPREIAPKPIAFKKRKLNSGAAKGNIRQTNNEFDT